MIGFAVFWLVCAVAAMALLNYRVPFGRWYWPDHEPLDAWLMAIVGGPMFLMAVAAVA